MRSKDERIYERMIELSWRIARFREESDPYGFKDALEPGESVEDGVRRTANETYGLLIMGRYDEVIGAVYNPDETCEKCRKASEKLVKEINAIRKTRS